MPTAAKSSKKTTPRQKHVPLRTCVVCRETSAKRTLMRIVRTSDTSFAIDPGGRANGRGAYLCDKPSCWEKAIATPILAKALRVKPDDASIHHIEEFAASLADTDVAPAEAAERS